ncbi:hypothetical protein QQZ08_009532 [Neonectria magnoliae]|uniref:Uncharacterized protein n=1 Tax=Neonectria magnoliae TaxID=2732573 RepID=A0ABR1HM75_9HYPO
MSVLKLQYPDNPSRDGNQLIRPNEHVQYYYWRVSDKFDPVDSHNWPKLVGFFEHILIPRQQLKYRFPRAYGDSQRFFRLDSDDGVRDFDSIRRRCANFVRGNKLPDLDQHHFGALGNFGHRYPVGFWISASSLQTSWDVDQRSGQRHRLGKFY